VESHYKPGGYMHSFDKMGYTYDSGAHYVGALQEREPFWALLQYLGAYDDSLFVPLDEEAFDTFYFKDQKVEQVSFGKGYERVIDHFSQLFPQERENIVKYFHLLRDTARNFPTYEFLVDYDQQSLLKALDTSLETVAKEIFSNQELLNAIYGYCGLHGVMPADVSFGLNSLIVDSLIRSGGYGFRGSGDALVNNLLREVEKLGGEVFLRHKITKFEFENSKVSAVVSQRGQVFKGDNFMFSGHPKDLLSLSGEDKFSKPYVKRIKNGPESIGILGLYGVAKRDAVPNIKRNYYYVSQDVPGTMPPAHSPSDEPMISFMTFPDREVPESEEKMAYSLHAPQFYDWVNPYKDNKLYSKDEGYIDLKSQISDSLFQLIDSFGFELKEKTIEFEGSTSLTNRRFNTSPEGSAYGIYHSMQYTGARALSGRTKVDNLYVTGQNTLFPGIMAASIAGLRTTGFMIGVKDHIKSIRKLMDS
ncbi:MAG: NAD(P)/FAD-dependent oxidoreductase, partial [Bdellovibrionales bacterium]|nr:FAD-dependent oxidoreductase [Bdellovibrionales bacterium]NQZ18224.1 NAD(P)/FAD-dependent oxidoreductase [Bdellovibrionales bacterium]